MRSLAVLFVPLAACAQLLSYDDYHARDAALPDSSVAVDSEIVEADVAVDSGPPPARVPARPSGAAMPSGSGKSLWLAVKTYSYGMSDASGTDSPDAWAAYGYDLDEVCTGEVESKENTNTCLRPMGADQSSLVDGDRCRDNNFGRHLSLALRTYLPNAEKTLNGLVQSGSTTWILRLDDVDTSADDAYAPGALYRSSDDRMAPPAWDGNDDRAVQSDSLTDGDINKPILSFPRGYISGGVWVSGDPSPIKVIAPITAIGFFPLPLQSALFTLELNAARTTGAHGLFVGVLPASDIQATWDQIADFAIVCPGTMLYENTLTLLKRTPDVTLGAPKLQDLTKTCDATSTAVAFEVIPIKPVTRVVAPSTPRKPRCGDAG